MRSFLALVALTLALMIAIAIPRSDTRSAKRYRTPVVGDPAVLEASYHAWRQQVADQKPELVLELFWSKGLSTRYTDAVGQARLHLVDGTVDVTVAGLQGTKCDVWLVDNRDGAGRSVRPERGDRIERVGSLVEQDGQASLKTSIRGRAAEGLAVDLVVVSPAGKHPTDEVLLYGTPTLFQRLYTMELRREREREDAGALRGPGVAMIVPPILPSAPPPDGPDDLFPSLVSKGEQLFFEETFDGNKRTCGTCHPAQNNLTIDPVFIDDLPDQDPLFVAEFIPELNHELNGGKRFENPVLMRTFGLILENLDGFGDLKKRFTMRGTPHTFAQRVSIKRPADGITPPEDRTGWGGDGAPFGNVFGIPTFGRLRDFTVGAVVQHFPKTTNRMPPHDFRMPTSDELTAIEAFMLTLGRQKDLELRDTATTPTLILADPDAEAGKVLFRDGLPDLPPTQTKCMNCHFNAGANVANGTNRNFRTGVELFLRNHPDPTGEPRPFDGGFGRAPDGTFPDPPIVNTEPPFDGGFGDNTFNTPGVVEFADTLPAFHNNVIDTIEDSILFYQTDEFAIGTNGGVIPFDEKQVAKVAQFMRVINAVDNLDNSAVRFAKRAIAALSQNPPDSTAANKALRFAIADVEDSIDVLREGSLHPEARAKLRHARSQFQSAMANSPPSVRIARINEGLEAIAKAREIMVLQG